LRQVPGVGGTLTALTFVLTTEDPVRFSDSRAVGAYLGFVPGRDQSGDSDPQQRISKRGDGMLRRLLVGSAHYLLGPFGKDSDLRRHGEKLAARGGGKSAKKRAVVAVARKLSVLLHRLWMTGETYDPLRNAGLTREERFQGA
jgi:transposase